MKQQQLWPIVHHSARTIPGWQLGLVGSWLVAMIAVPILHWTWGEAGLRWGVVATVCLLATVVLAILWHAWGWQRTAKVMMPIIVLAWLVERIGHTTGYPFGEYSYTTLLQPQIGGVPVIIPLAWLMMLPPAWAVASELGAAHGSWRFILLSAAAFTAWDFFLDPQMVAWGYWQWHHDGGYFGIPWLNFAGWFASAALITWLVKPGPTPTRSLRLIYVTTWLLQSMGQALFWAMPGPAFVGFFAMGGFVILLAQRQRRLRLSPFDKLDGVARTV